MTRRKLFGFLSVPLARMLPKPAIYALSQYGKTSYAQMAMMHYRSAGLMVAEVGSIVEVGEAEQSEWLLRELVARAYPIVKALSELK